VSEAQFSGRQLDTARLHDAIAAAALHRRISARTVAAESGLSQSTLSRIKNGQKPDADGLLSLLAWLGYDPPFARRADG
jgi:transcriptional regulator with XRE-family HTH domain